MKMRNFIIGGIAVVATLIVGSIFFGCERIDAGHAGVKVELYGSDRGVQDIELVTGMVWYNRFTTAVYEFPTYVREIKYQRSVDQDSTIVNDNSIHCTTADGMTISFDVSMNYSVRNDEVSEIFRKYRLPLEDLETRYLYTSVRNAYNSVAGQMTAEHIISNRKVYEDSVRRVLVTQLTKEGFEIQQITIAGKIFVPQSLEQAINSKITAVQNAQRAENEKQQTIAEAQKQIESARGDSASTIIRARADAEANKLRQQSLTPLLVQKEMIDKWDGALPQYGTVPQLFRDVTK
jgi:regulator of protease activity HflC (stomatin/prohibitin superfamily)